jgi:hypothetical protein
VSDVYYYLFRILLSIPFGVSLSRLAPEIGAPLAFLLGTFPTTTLFTIARRTVSQHLKLGDDRASGRSELEKLPAVSRSAAERFNDEGVTSIAALARADPVDLTIKTNFDLSYVVDCISQALMWNYLGQSGNCVFPAPLRGACEIAILIGGLEDSRFADGVRQTIADAAAKLNISQEALTTTLQQIASNPYTKLLGKLSPKN